MTKKNTTAPARAGKTRDEAARFKKVDQASGTIGVDVLANTALLNFTFHRWGNRVKADAAPQDTKQSKKGEADKTAERIRSTLRLIESDAYDAIIKYQNDARQWLLRRCMPSFMVKGVFLVSVEMVDVFEAKLAEVRDWLKTVGVPALIADYDRAITQAEIDMDEITERLRCAPLFDADNYPKAVDMRTRYYVTHSWMSFGVPQNLPDKIRAQEQAKMEIKFNEAAEEITAALREMFQELVNMATEKLTVQPGEGKKGFTDQALDKFREFFETFQARNLTNDRDLEQLVAQAKDVLQGVNPKQLKNQTALRTQVTAQMRQVKKSLDALIVESGTRRFTFDDDDEA